MLPSSRHFTSSIKKSLFTFFRNHFPNSVSLTALGLGYFSSVFWYSAMIFRYWPIIQPWSARIFTSSRAGPPRCCRSPGIRSARRGCPRGRRLTGCQWRARTASGRCGNAATARPQCLRDKTDQTLAVRAAGVKKRQRAVTLSDTASLPTCWKTDTTFGRCRSCSATRTSPLPWFTRTF